MAKHTEGPWSRVEGERFRHDNSAGVRAANNLYIAAALDRNSYDLDEEVEANARLIAASPDLLACAEELAAWIDREHPIWDIPDDVELMEMRQLLGEALAKARGEKE